MQPFYFNYSLKSIPIPNRLQYQKILLLQGESFIKRLRWHYYFVQNPNVKQHKQVYGFNTTKPSPFATELKSFEEEFFSLIKDVRFRPVHNNFQTTLKKDIKKIQDSNQIIVSADKSRNKYELSVNDYKKLLRNNITCKYKKVDQNHISNTNIRAAKIAKDLEIEDRVDKYIEANSYVTIKDHKENFPSKVECRLINPAKSNMGRISKIILEKINNNVRRARASNQWLNSSQVINWFKHLKNKDNLTFVKFDIVSFYPSITKKMLEKSVMWAKDFCNIPQQDIDVINNSRESYLFKDDEIWTKKDNNFDVTMGAYDGAEICELIGLYILSKLETLINKEYIGLYRDDGLAVVNMSGPQIEQLRKKLFTAFKTLGFSVKIQANVTATDFLDIWFDLKNESYKPYRKENNTPVYIDINSNHPQTIKKQLPNMIQKRLSLLSSSNKMFQTELPIYQEALLKAGYKDKLNYENKPKPVKRKRKRKILWFNPPYSQSVKTNVGAKFLGLVDKHFKDTPLQKYFNRNTIKVSYCCMPNMETIISNHNRKILKVENENSKKENENKKLCNCRNTLTCPLQGKCLESSIVYKAEVSTSETTSSYIGLASNSFKERYNNHLSTFRHENKAEHTTLSKHIWDLNHKKTPYNLKWSIIGRASSYNKASKICQICLLEKSTILWSNYSNPLNKRTEIMNTCKHRKKHLLSSSIDAAV